MNNDGNGDLIDVFAGTSIEAGMILSLLKDSGIESFLKDDNIGTIAPWQVTSGGVGSVQVVISKHNFDKAKLIIEAYK